MKRIRYNVFLGSLAVGSLCIGFCVFDYLVLFAPYWAPTTADQILGFDAFFHYLQGHGLFFIGTGVLALWLSGLMWVLPGSLWEGRWHEG